jgi:hypothetical protein
LNRLALYLFVKHDLFGKPASTFPDHALVKHDLFGKPASTFPDHALTDRISRRFVREMPERLARQLPAA